MRSEKKDGTQKVSLSFLFTADTFRLDKTKASVLPAHKEWKERFGRNRYKALFYLGFGERPEEASASFGYLHFMSESCGSLKAIPVIEETGIIITDETVRLIPGL